MKMWDVKWIKNTFAFIILDNIALEEIASNFNIPFIIHRIIGSGVFITVLDQKLWMSSTSLHFSHNNCEQFLTSFWSLTPKFVFSTKLVIQRSTLNRAPPYLDELGLLQYKKYFVFIYYLCLQVVFLPLFCIQKWRHGVMNCVGSSLEMNSINKLQQIDRSLII